MKAARIILFIAVLFLVDGLIIIAGVFLLDLLPVDNSSEIVGIVFSFTIAVIVGAIINPLWRFYSDLVG